MVPFAGWEMPLHYGSQVAEHHAVRAACGLFDVSHMVVVDLHGGAVFDTLRRLLANDVTRLQQDGGALYSCLLNAAGGILDDLIVYRIAADRYRLVLNAATADRDIEWIRSQGAATGFELARRDDLAILALQGPEAVQRMDVVTGGALRVAELARFHGGWWFDDGFVARTGYTGEDGVELMLPRRRAVEVWGQLLDTGVAPVGLGARDTLRLEAALNLYGSDMDEGVNPFECGLGWTVAWEPQERDFIGRQALQACGETGPRQTRVGLVSRNGVMRAGMRVLAGGVPVGQVTSGGFGPTVNASIALARVDATVDGQLDVEIRGKVRPVEQVPLPFVRGGRSRVPPA